MKNFKIFLLSFLIVFSFLFVAHVQAATYYVDKDSRGGTCSNSNSGTSLTAPWCTIARANSALQAGDTVFVRAGNYNENNNNSVILPQRSGSAGSYITYKNYPGERPILSGCYQPVTLAYNYIWVEGFEITDAGDNATWVGVRVGGGSYNIIRDLVIHDLEGPVAQGPRGVWFHGGAHHNQVIGCNIYNIGRAWNNPYFNDDGDGIWIDTNNQYNLILNNTFDTCGHVMINVMGNHNVIRGNNGKGTWGMCVGLFGNLDMSPAYNVADYNICHDQIGTEEPQYPYPYEAFPVESANSIVRRNVLYRGHGDGILLYAYGGGGQSYSATGSHVYNNVVHDFGFEGAAGRDRGLNFDSGDNNNLGRCYVKNNILYQNHTDIGTLRSAQLSNHVISNNFLTSNGNPQFTNLANHVFTLQSSSPCIDAGDWLTTITSANGSGTTFTVADAGYFFNGYGLVDGDEIQLQGQTTTVRVTSVDYANNRITVDRSLTWTNGLGVALPYSGNAPDIGAYEYTGTAPTPPPSPDTTPPQVTAFDVQPRTTTGSITATYTVTDNQALIRVELWRTTDSNGQPNNSNWTQVTGRTISGTSSTGQFTDTPATGIYWYGIHVVDSANNTGVEASSIRVIANIAPPTLSVSLSANPSSGSAPLIIDLTAVVSGTATGTINYTFYCNRSDSGTNITTPYAAKYDGVSQTTYNATDVCTYNSAGTYSAKVIVERGTTLQAERRVSIIVSVPSPPSPPPPLPPPTPICGDDSCNGTETCSSCPSDCGVCPPTCGDSSCNGSETCSSCPLDCGVCPSPPPPPPPPSPTPICGDDSCNGTETCSSCPSDCGACPSPPPPSPPSSDNNDQVITINSPFEREEIKLVINSIGDLLYAIAIGGGVIMVMISGIIIMTAGADEEKLRKGKKMLKWTIIGVLIASASGLIANIIQGILS